MNSTVPAPTYLPLSLRRPQRRPSACGVFPPCPAPAPLPGSSGGRRCTEQSRSNRCTQVPCVSANTCISMCRGRVRYFSISTRSSAKGRSRLPFRGSQRLGKFARLIHHPHAFAAAAGRRLDQYRITDAISLLCEDCRFLRIAVITGHQRHAGLFHQRLCRRLRAHGIDGRRWRSDEHNARLLAGARKVGVLGKEAIARDGLPARRFFSRPPIRGRRAGKIRADATARSARPRRNWRHARLLASASE